MNLNPKTAAKQFLRKKKSKVRKVSQQEICHAPSLAPKWAKKQNRFFTGKVRVPTIFEVNTWAKEAEERAAIEEANRKRNMLPNDTKVTN